ncbi:MAG: hypothetical protein LBH59_05400 [Planctomycetaceae bacterium]|nr:hypothetical protein [Planctomycetaceae bacterium]
MRLSLSVFSVFIVTIITMVMGCHEPGFLRVHDHSPYVSPPVAGPGPGVIPPVQTPLPPMPLAPPIHNTGAAMTPSMYYPMTLNVPYDSPATGISGGASPSLSPSPAIMSPALGNVSATVPTHQTPQSSTSQINFDNPEALIIHYDAKVPGAFDSEPLICPATHEFVHGTVYRLKLSNIPGHPGKELYPTLEVAPSNPKTFAYLVHCPVPISFTDNDFDQVFSGNLITKVIYLPNREFQGLATVGVGGIGTIVNTDLEPGIDPIREAQNRGSILAIVRMGNKDLRLTESELKRREALVASLPPGVSPQAAIPSEPIQSSISGTFISGRDIPAYGTPMTKTTTGVPGPPQLPYAMDSGYRYPVIRAEPIPAPPSTRAYPQPGGSPYGYPPTMPNIQSMPNVPNSLQPSTGYLPPPPVPNFSPNMTF